MQIGIIGAGHVGGTLTRRLSALGHDVAVANSRGPDTLADLARETGASPVTGREAAAARDIVIVSIPEKSILELPAGLLARNTTAAVIDTGNYYPQRDGRIDEIEDGMPESEWVSEQLRRPVVKAFNNIYARHLMERGRPEGSPERIALPVAGDDPAAKGVVLRLVEELGFDAIDAGPLSESWRQQPGTPVYTTDLDANGVREALQSAQHERPDDLRAPSTATGRSTSPRPDARA